MFSAFLQLDEIMLCQPYWNWGGGIKKKDEGKKNVGAPHNMTGETNYHFGLIILECLRTLLKNCRRLLSISDKQQIQI